METEPVFRCSEDKTLNAYGKQLLNICIALNFCIANGVCNSDPEGRYTYVSDTGNSVSDYFLVSDGIFCTCSAMLPVTYI